MKRVLISIFILVCFVCSFLNIFSFALSDVTNPTIDTASLKVSDTNPKVGDTVEVSVKVTDDTEVKSVNITYLSPETGKIENISMTYNAEKACYLGYITIREDMEAGIWNVNYIWASDTSLNIAYAYPEAGKGSFTVSKTIADVTKPTIDIASLKVSDTNPKVGDTVEVSVKVTDDTEVKSVNITYLTPETGKIENISMTYNAEKACYLGYITIREDMEAGIWNVNYIWASDTSLNIAYAYPEAGKGSFTVSKTIADVTKPTIDIASLKVSDENPKVGDTVEVSVKVTDDTEVKSVNITYLSPETGKIENISMTYNAEKACYLGYITIREDMEAGIWNVNYIWASDTSLNIAYAYPEAGKGSFTVSKTIADVTKPTIDIASLKVSDENPKVGDTVEVSVKVTDDTEVKSVNITYLSPETGKIENISMTYNAEKACYLGYITIREDMEAGIWNVNYIWASDTSLNIAYAYPEAGKGSFTVSKTIADVTKPTIDIASLKVSDENPKVGDTVEVSVKVTDDTEVKSVNITYLSPETGKIENISMTYNAEKACYLGYITIREDMEAGIWNVNYIWASDTSLNIAYAYPEAGKGSFTVSKTIADVTKPTIDIASLKVSDENPKVGDTVEVSVKVTDDTEVKSVNITYLSPETGKIENISMTYNAEKACYLGYITIREDMEAGIWNVNYIWASDTSLNIAYAYPEAGKGSFTVSKTIADVTKPTIDIASLKVSDENPKVGDTVEVSVKVTDDTEVKSVNITYLSPETGKIENISMTYNAEKACYLGYITIREDMEAGIWNVNYIWASDTSLNIAYAYPEAGKGSFTVVEDNDIVLGDVNKDGLINSADALCVLQHSVGLIVLSDDMVLAADVNKDNLINSSDALLILQFSVELITEL